MRQRPRQTRTLTETENKDNMLKTKTNLVNRSVPRGRWRIHARRKRGKIWKI